MEEKIFIVVEKEQRTLKKAQLIYFRSSKRRSEQSYIKTKFELKDKQFIRINKFVYSKKIYTSQ